MIDLDQAKLNLIFPSQNVHWHGRGSRRTWAPSPIPVPTEEEELPTPGLDKHVLTAILFLPRVTSQGSGMGGYVGSPRIGLREGEQLPSVTGRVGPAVQCTQLHKALVEVSEQPSDSPGH